MRKTVQYVIMSAFLMIGAFSSPLLADDGVQIHNYHFDGNVSVWDVSGNYSDSNNLTMDYTMAQDAKGKIAGFGTADFSEDDFDMEMDFVLKGMVTTRRNETTVKFKMKMQGAGEFEEIEFRFKANVSVAAVIDSLVGEMVGTMKMKIGIKAKGYGSETFSDVVTFDQDVPVGMDGTSDLVLTTHAEGDSKVLGSGVFTLSNGEKFNYLVKGKLNVKKATGKLALKAADELSKGSKFKLYTDDELDLDKVKGKALGQKIEFEREDT